MLPVALVAVAWTAVALVVGDTFNSPAAYLITSAIFLAIILVGGAIIWRPKLDMRGDVIVLQPRGVGYLLLNIVGGLLSIPFRIFTWLGSVLRNLAPRS
jgi:hypothetical protein